MTTSLTAATATVTDSSNRLYLPHVGARTQIRPGVYAEDRLVGGLLCTIVGIVRRSGRTVLKLVETRPRDARLPIWVRADDVTILSPEFNACIASAGAQ